MLPFRVDCVPGSQKGIAPPLSHFRVSMLPGSFDAFGKWRNERGAGTAQACHSGWRPWFSGIRRYGFSVRDITARCLTAVPRKSGAVCSVSRRPRAARCVPAKSATQARVLLRVEPNRGSLA